ncbi:MULTISPECIES: helix-turn-helix domain-containing protein [Metabacillus]|uniref:helix-turn-helix domain-containing protein n=1 Tax=Metabacillus TaxID=2675233 RepID=UPI000689E76E|nr:MULTISPECIES: helix-turn-helix domain-containing protein [Metabacillus]MDX8289717.1 helix-turn-helix domain-containing protein [Metabacillus indicus]
MVTAEKTKTNLLDENIMSSAQACKEWGIDDSALRKRVNQFPPGTIRKFGKTWVVTSEGMCRVFGEKRRNGK